jgi:uncharacterized alpha-E superfamily protein
MLARTADQLFWMARYTERAENTARMLEVSMQTALLPQSAQSADLIWEGILGICELQDPYEASHGALASGAVLDFMTRDPANPSSIYSCLLAARENARAVRGALTTEVWETINSTWLEFRRRIADRALERDPSRLFEWVKYRSHLARGTIVGTMLADEGLCFTRLGTFLERSDNTARILDVKYHALAERGEPDPDARAEDGGPRGDVYPDFYHWAAILRSVSALEVYRKTYSDVITPARVAELLIMRAEMPRSLLNCINEVVSSLALVSNSRSHETERLAGQLQADLRYGRIDAILEEGLHAYLTRFLARVNGLGDRISRDFLVPLSVA